MVIIINIIIMSKVRYSFILKQRKMKIWNHD